MRKREINLIDGVIWKSILFFAMPLLIGNLFQQMYSTVDSYVVGNYVGTTALASVGASTPIINVLIGFFMGLSAGAGVVIAQRYGARNLEGVKTGIHTAMALTIFMTVVLTIIGVFVCDDILRLIAVPDDIFQTSYLYLKIYFLGIGFTLLYNLGSGVLRALGDSKRPIYFLIIASILNVILDILFVKYLGMGVAGVAIATMISQAVSSFLVLLVLLNLDYAIRLNIKKIAFDYPTLIKMIKIGLPTAIQQSVISLSNVIVQSYINTFGSYVVAGYSAGLRIDGFVVLPVQSINMSITTFVGQNIGAKKYDRVKKGARCALIMLAIIIFVLCVFLYLFGEAALALFDSTPEVVAAGRTLQLCFIPFYIILPIVQVYSGVLYGAGKSTIPMCLTIFNFVILRQIYLYIMVPITGSLATIFYGWPITWITCAIMFLIYYHRVSWLPEE